MFCKNCGKEIADNSIACTNCGAQTGNSEDTGNVGWALLGFFVPVAGIVLYFVWKNQKPKTAKKCITGFFVNFGISVVLVILSILAGSI